jgi:hypothetical protein
MTIGSVGRRLLVILTVVAVFAAAAVWAFRNVGRWLVIQDNLQPARAIVVLSGRMPFRAVEAAQIYHQGWGPEVWLFKDDPDEADEVFASLGMHDITQQDYNQ